MTSRERVRKMIKGELNDSFCISAGGIPNDSMSAFAYAKLLKELNITDSPMKIYDLFQYLPILDERVVDRLGGDFLHCERPRFRFNLHKREWKPGKLDDGTPCYFPAEFDPILEPLGSKAVIMDGEIYARMPKNGFYYDIIKHPLEDVEDTSELRLIHPATYLSDEDIDTLCKDVEDMYTRTDKSIILLLGGQHIEQAQRDFGFEEFYCKMAIEKELMHAYFRMITDSYLDALERILKRVGDKIDVIWFCDDVGTQQTLQISIPMFREMVKPYKKEMFGYIHENYPDIAVLFHSCGAIFDLIPDFIDMGVNMLNPVQISANGMDPQRLKDTYGKDIIFWGGGIDTQSMTPEQSVEEVREKAQHLVEIFSKGGNYVFTQVHNFQANTTPDKILAVYDAAKEHRRKMELGLLK